MAASLGPVLFAYISLVFQVTHRICLMQCNPMSGAGMFHGDMGDLRFSGSHVESDGSVRDRREPLNTRQIRFDPSYLDFTEQPVGMPRIKTVTIINPHMEQSLQLHSISGSTVHFHASFFLSKVVQPLGNTTFDIVFLARLVGNAENTLFIHTSKGVYPYQVFGVGIPNPYRLRPFLGARVPVNFSFTSLINMHNPYNTPLQVVEMYSSGGDLHLELPSGLEEAPQKHWEIPPYETKALMRVSFIGRSASNHTAFIRIKASNPAPSNEFLILPVEVEVTSVPGVFPSVDLLDFGTLRTMDEPKAVGLYLLNSGPKHVHVSSIAVEPGNSAVSITFSPIVLKPGGKYIKVATVTYSAYHVKRTRQSNGRIIIRTNNKSSLKLVVPFQANVLQGTIAYSVSKTRFFIGEPLFVPVLRELPITNTFDFTMIIYDAVFPQEVQSLFSIVNFTKPAMIPPQKTATPFYVRFVANDSDESFSTILRVYTNASIFTVPIHCYNGKVKYVVDNIEEDVVDYGTVGTGENRTKLMKITNHNPVEVIISKITCNVDFASVKLLDVRPDNDSRQQKSNNSPPAKNQPSESSNEPGKVAVKPGYIAAFSVEVCVPKKEGQYPGEIEISTDYEVLHIPIYFKAMDGKITSSPPSVAFPPGFPGRIESQTLSLSSTFSHPLKLLSIKPHPLDARFYFVPHGNGFTQIPPNKNVKVGSVRFDPSLGCTFQCYMGQGTTGTKWLSTLTLPADVGNLDNQYADRLQRLYDSLKQSGKTRVNVSFIIDTDVVKRLRLPVQAALTWPSLSPDKPVKFPLTHVGNYSIKHFLLENPADVPVVVQIVPLSVYPQGFLDVIADRFDADTYGLEQDDNIFTLPDLENEKKDIHSSVPVGVTPAINGVLGVTPAQGSSVTILKPRSKVKIRLKFVPKDDSLRTSVVLIRNNLTVMDAVTVQGQGARGEFMLNGKKPGMHSTLLFELKSVHLSDCHKDTPRSRALPPLSVKKVLTATNPGQLAILVSSLSINGYECEGYGFKVLNCKSFILNPNTSRKIEIAFTPDFTMSRVTRKLEVKTTLGPIMEFTLVATIPPHLLPLCAAAVSRTSWEPVFQITAVAVMGIVFLAVIVAAYSEAKKILGACIPDSHLLQLNSEERGQIFDLSAIAGVKPKTNKEERHISFRRPRRDTKDSKSDDRPANGEAGATAAILTQPPTNNNVNKNSGSTTPRHENGNTRNRSPKTDNNKGSHNSNDVADRGTRAGSVDSNDGSKKTSPATKETKLRSGQETRLKNTDSSNSGRRSADLYKNSADFKRDYRAPVADIEELRQSIANVQEMESENAFVWVDNCKKDYKEPKSKSKKKSKTTPKRDEKEQRIKSKDRNTRQQDRDDDGACSDDSGSDGSSEKVIPEVSINQLNDKRQRRGSLPNDSSIVRQRDHGSRGVYHTTDGHKNPGAPSGVDSTLSKSRKTDYQIGRPKTLDLPARMKDRTAVLQAEARESGPTSPHAIAAAVMSHLEKSLQTTTKDNNCNEHEGRRKAFSKPLVTSHNLADSPPTMSPTNLSGSSRSSSYSSIVSDGSSSGSDQCKGSVTNVLKQRLKSSRSMPLGDLGSPSLFEGGTGEQPGAPTGLRKQNHSEQYGLAVLRKSPWSTSAESALAPGSHNANGHRLLTSQYAPVPSGSLFEGQPFSRLANTTGSVGGRMQGSPDGSSRHHPFDFSAFGISDGAAGQNQGRPSIWSAMPGECMKEKQYGNHESLFSTPPKQSDDPFLVKPARHSNNWVNFLDASRMANSIVRPTALNNKTVSEIWDSGSAPADGDGWSLCAPCFHPEFNPRAPQEDEVDPIDALLHAIPPEWASGTTPEQGNFGCSDASWASAPNEVSSIWSNQFPNSSSEAPPVTSASHAFQAMSPEHTKDSPKQESPGGTFDALRGLGGTLIWPQTRWSSGKE